MKKLNRKGYMTIEIILAAVVTFVIAFFLIDLTMKLSSTTDDAYADTVLTTDKALIIKNVRENLENDISKYGDISEVNCVDNNCNIVMGANTVTLSIEDNLVKYEGSESYSKEINNSLTDITLSYSNSDSGWYHIFRISGTNIFVDENYDINIILYDEPIPVLAKGNTWYRGSTDKSTITKISLVDTYSITGNETESWDAAANLGGEGFSDQIKCYVNGTELVIVGNGSGKIYANSNSESLFDGFSSVTSIDLSILDTSIVTNMKYMFRKCSLLTTLDLSTFNTENVTNMSTMFAGCSNLVELNVSSFKTKNVTNMYEIFNGCSKLRTLDVSKFTTNNLTDARRAFANCSSLTGLEVSGWDTTKLTNAEGMFVNCSALKELNISNWFTSGNIINIASMFRGCSSLTTLDVSNWNTKNVTSMKELFYGCSSLKTLDLSGWNTDKVKGSLTQMFLNCSSLKTLDLSKFNTVNVTDIGSMFAGCSSLTELKISNWNTKNVTSMQSLFSGCSSLTTLDLSGWETPKLENTIHMFSMCESLKTIDLSKATLTGVVGDNRAATFYGVPNNVEIKIKDTEKEWMDNYIEVYWPSFENNLTVVSSDV